MNKKLFPILIAEDDPDDRFLIKEAFEENKILNELIFVSDGEQLLNYLRHGGEYREQAVRQPGLILLDLNMPKMDGRQALQEIKTDPELKKIPVVVLTTSTAEQDISSTYDLGVNSFITKPVTFDELVETVKSLGTYWFQIVSIPEPPAQD